MATQDLASNLKGIEQQFVASLSAGAITPAVMLINMSLALVFGLLLASVYRYTHKGLSYSQSFTLTIVFVTTIVAISLMAIESSLARAFALVGALSIIRFRTVVKDTKDTAYVFAGLAVGLAAGTNNYYLTVMSGSFICVLALVLHRTNFGANTKNEFVLRFAFRQDHDSSNYLEPLKKICRNATLLQAEASADGRHMILSYDVLFKGSTDMGQFASELARVSGISDVSLIASKTDVDY
jgi:uncharacterized membrane protein YhiD involved in acid resistance